MTKRIWKYEMSAAGYANLSIPQGSQFLRVGQQDGTVCLWFMVDDSAVQEMRHFIFTGTGHAVPEEGKYLGSADCPPFVWHVFEV